MRMRKPGFDSTLKQLNVMDKTPSLVKKGFHAHKPCFLLQSWIITPLFICVKLTDLVLFLKLFPALCMLMKAT